MCATFSLRIPLEDLQLFSCNELVLCDRIDFPFNYQLMWISMFHSLLDWPMSEICKERL
jgi:hypothetical protein